jgi:hypothetical protein
MTTNQSNVARIRKQIELESQSAFNGLHGLSLGTAKHDVINQKLDRIGKLQEELTMLIGAEQAEQIIVEVFS